MRKSEPAAPLCIDDRPQETELSAALDPVWRELHHLSLEQILEAEIIRRMVRGGKRRRKMVPRRDGAPW